ncbi:MAG: hypothetical protein OEQ18_14710, partial [Gammaproteobacteria bacterium]|nr:hypothetical protein [Gammaproteobacteria bacterium]
RVSTDQPLALFTHWPQHPPVPANLTDLSLDGIQFDCTQPIESHTNIKIESALLDAVVRTVYRPREAALQGYTAGRRFLTLRLHKNRGAFLSVET